jgi:hypothetical protein
MFPHYPPLGKLHWLLVNYIFGKPQRMKAILESDIKTKPIGSIFLNSVKSQEAIIFYMLDKGLLDIDNYKEEIEIFKIGFPEDKVIIFSERALNKYLKSKIASPPSEQAPPPKTTKPLHFTRSFTPVELKQVYKGLATGVYFPKSTNKKAFKYIFSGKGKPENFIPLEWQPDSIALLAYMIENLFADTDNTRKWKITEHCFRVKGEKPNINTLKKAISDIKQYKDKPKGHDAIDSILKF